MGDYRILFRGTGGPDVLEREDVLLPPPGSGEVRVRHEAIGLNFIDIYHRSGLYAVSLPSGIGQEAAGVVEAVGPGVADFAPGDRVAYAMGPLGAYASARNIAADLLVGVPEDVPSDIAAAAILKGLTTEFMVERCARMQPGQTALVHAAAGGVGQLLVQWLKAIGVRVFAHAGSEAKADVVRALGIADVASVPMEEVAPWVRAGTGGRGVEAVFDGVGADSWAASLASVAKRGLIISFGNASGPVPPISPLDLLRAGSVFLTRPTIADYCSTAAERRAAAARVFAMIGSGAVKVDIGARFALGEAAKAHEALAGRGTTGSTVLTP